MNKRIKEFDVNELNPKKNQSTPWKFFLTLGNI